MKKAIIFLLILASGCGWEETYYRIDPRLQPYLDSFYSEGEKRGHTFKRENLILRLKKGLYAKDKAYGRTIRNIGMLNGDQIEVQIDEDFYFEKLNEYVRDETGLSSCIESVTFHEFGHAFFRRDHTNTFSLMNNTTASTCMGWNGFTYNGVYHDQRKKLIDELFNPGV